MLLIHMVLFLSVHSAPTYQAKQRIKTKLNAEMNSHAPEPSSIGRRPASRTLRKLVSRPIAPSESASRN